MPKNRLSSETRREQWRRAAGLSALAITLMASPLSLAGRAQAPLDGLVFHGEMTVSHTGVILAERITFSAGLFHSLACDRFGYTDGPYSVERRGDTLYFQAFTESPTLGTMTWHGEIVDGTLQARAIAREPDEPERLYTVAARRREASEPSTPPAKIAMQPVRAGR